MWDNSTQEERVTVRLSDGEVNVTLSLGLQDLRKVCETLLLASQTTERQYCFLEQRTEVHLSSKCSQARNDLRSTSQNQEISWPASPGWLKPTVSIQVL